TLEQLADVARQQNTSLFRAVPLMSGKGGSNLAKFAELVQQMAHEAQILTLPELVEHVIHHSGLLAHYQNDREGAERLENLQELVNAAAAFTAEENFDGLPAGRIPDPSGSFGSGANTAAGDIPFTASARSSEIAPASASAAQPGAEVGPMSPLAAFLTHASLEAGDNQ